ncbi:MAG TPA: T9SS type A sorting domain-containing protein [Flavobacteriales bacterium]|jgi:hypothetical protein|nr:T9SS type A sorting domain-containing protein [Flavobacteriales bacterium]MBK7113647.1 T9SS type A sorting domain-containing protein [Flavobacteriales bacterium]MBK7619878.1 T9SS type A sorting domain-containing protein [Flavobacteriales bacterium]MBK8531009.1 T9SS type A sorting domain-containing protein [Flavobacteriales bacterium]MBP9159673.1 T9SS type A sorting domain-containing protein [Flavobacteriales bacterium]
MRILAFLPVCLLLCSTSSAQIPGYVPTDGLIGWWPFNGNANDESGGGNDGTLYGPEATQDRNGTANAAYDFNGISSHITIPNIAVQGTAPRTYSFWMRTSNQVGGMMLCTGSGTNQNGGTFNIRHGNGGQFTGFMGGNFTAGGYDYDPPGNVVVNDEQWHHVVVTYDGSILSFYIDGSFEKATTLSLFTAGQTNYVGRANNQLPEMESWYQGKVDDIGAWGRVLTPQEIMELFNAFSDTPCLSPTAASFTGLAGGYVLSDGPTTLSGTPANGLFIGSGISGNTFDPALAGEGTHGISYVVMDEDGCVSSYALCTDVTLGMGIQGSNMPTGGVRVFPNPNRGQFTVELDLEGLVSLQVFDAGGRIAHTEVFQAKGGQTMRILDLGALAKGTYNLQVRLGENSVSQRIVLE